MWRLNIFKVLKCPLKIGQFYGFAVVLTWKHIKAHYKLHPIICAFVKAQIYIDFHAGQPRNTSFAFCIYIKDIFLCQRNRNRLLKPLCHSENWALNEILSIESKYIHELQTYQSFEPIFITNIFIYICYEDISTDYWRAIIPV